jgi:hypothetical protein
MMAKGGKVEEDQALKPNQRTFGFNAARSRGAGIVSKQINAHQGGNVTANNYKLQQAYSKDKESPEQKHDQVPVKLWDGGDIAKGISNAGAINAVTPQSSPAPQQQSQDDKYAAIRKQNKANMGYADGGPVVDPNQAQQAQDSMRKAFHFADGGPVSDAKDDPSHAMLSEAIKNLSSKYIVPEDKAAPQAPVDQAPSPAVASQGSQPQQQAPQIPQQQPQLQPQGTLPQQAQQDLNQQTQANTAMGQNTAASLSQQSKIQGQGAQQMSGLQQRYEDIGNQLHKNFEDTAQQVASAKIDPQGWWHNKNTGQKVLTAIGMLFAGAGGGVAGHPEAASNLINKFIDNDIEAQKADINNKNTLLGKYMEMYNSVPQAENAARLTLGSAIEGQINQQASKLGSQNAQLAAQSANGALRQQLLPQIEGLARGQVMSQMYGNMNQPNGGAQSGSAEQQYQDRMQNMRVLNPDLGKDMQDKYLPGVGVSRVPVPDALREKLAAQSDLSDKLAKLELFANQHQGTVLDRAIVNQGKTLAADAQQAARVAGHQGVFKESDQKFLESMIDPDPTKFGAAIRTLPKYKQLRDSNNSTMKTYFKSYGVKPFESNSGPESGQMRVRLNSTGETGTIPVNEFDPKLYSKVQ